MTLPFGVSDLAQARAVTRAQLRYGRHVLDQLQARQYTRDKEGKFASTGGVREALANAGDVPAINSAAAAEAERITGRTGDRAIAFAFAGSDPQIAREHAEGILQGLERFPRAPLRRVDDFNPDEPESLVHYGHLADSMAYTSMGFTQGSIHFNVRYSGDPAKYGRALEHSAVPGPSGKAFLSDPTVTGVALHEFGHILTSRHGEEGTPPKVPAVKIATEMAREQSGRGITTYVRGELSEYATSNSHELNAEAFADVMAHGDGAAPVSRAIFVEIEALYG